MQGDFVDRLDGIGINDPHPDAFRFELLVRTDAFVQSDPRRDNRNLVRI